MSCRFLFHLNAGRCFNANHSRPLDFIILESDNILRVRGVALDQVARECDVGLDEADIMDTAESFFGMYSCKYSLSSQYIMGGSRLTACTKVLVYDLRLITTESARTKSSGKMSVAGSLRRDCRMWFVVGASLLPRRLTQPWSSTFLDEKGLLRGRCERAATR